MNRPGFIGTGLCGSVSIVLSAIGPLELGGRDVADRLGESSVIEPVGPLERAELDVVDAFPRAASTDQLALVEPNDRLGERVVVAVALGSDRVHGSLLAQTLGVADREVLPPLSL